ncbi:MarR family transcriptional regulator [Leptolyngbya sp. 15MV]|nr:MarR family transcriptional regulator [Leptolyngbya sp. 15MV]
MDRVGSAREQWRRERPDLDPRWDALFGRITDAAALLTRDHLEPLFERFGLQRGEFAVLAALRRSGAPFALSPTTLYETTMISSGAMTNRIDRLEADKLVERRPDPNDRRGKLIVLTAKGRALIDQTVMAHVENEVRLLGAALSAKEQRTLATLLAKLVAGLPPAKGD